MIIYFHSSFIFVFLGSGSQLINTLSSKISAILETFYFLDNQACQKKAEDEIL
jgi:hypothetical protein